jgi:hypothetical protein
MPFAPLMYFSIHFSCLRSFVPNLKMKRFGNIIFKKYIKDVIFFDPTIYLLVYVFYFHSGSSLFRWKYHKI